MKTLLIGVLALASFSVFAQTRECQEGELVTLAVPFEGVIRGSIIKKFEPGSQFRLDRIDAYSGRYIVELSQVKATGVSAITNPQNGDIIGCSIQTRIVESTRVCVGMPGYCYASYDPKRLTFNECSLNP